MPSKYIQNKCWKKSDAPSGIRTSITRQGSEEGMSELASLMMNNTCTCSFFGNWQVDFTRKLIVVTFRCSD